MESESGEMYAYANSNWVYIDTKNMKPQRPPEEEIIAYGIDEKLDMEYAPIKIKKSDEWKTLESFPARKFHLDTNRHVNNSQYVQMALEVSGLKSRPRQVRVEYLRQAVYQDKIIPRVWKNEEKEIVELAGEEQIFALVEFLK